MDRFINNIRIVVGGCALIILFFTAILAPVLSPFDPNKMNPAKSLKDPGQTYLLGTDDLGRDIFSRLVYGTRISLTIALTAVFLAAVCGVFLGLLAGYAGGLTDTAVMRMVDILMSFPPILFAIAIVAFLGTGVPHMVAAIAILYTPRFARIAYSSTMSVKENDYVKASRAIGTSHSRIIVQDILPNIMAPIIILISLSVGTAILLESGLSFLGMGPPPPTATWGNMIGRSRDLMDIKPIMVVWPSAAIAMTVLAFNILGDGLRDVLDPRLKI
jgi:ABC-type dipeptide/oligopeptide/nickel transport system permease subunit